MTEGPLPYVDPGPHRGASSAAIARRMSTVRRRDNGPEMAVRRALRARGVGYRVCLRVPGQRRRSIDIASLRARLAVYIDGCFCTAARRTATCPGRTGNGGRPRSP